MTLPTAGEDDPRLPTDDDIAAAAADAAGPEPGEPDLAVDREARRLQDGAGGSGSGGSGSGGSGSGAAAAAERVAQQPDF